MIEHKFYKTPIFLLSLALIFFLIDYNCSNGQTPARIINTNPPEGALEILEGTTDFKLNCEVRGNPEPQVIIARGRKIPITQII